MDTLLQIKKKKKEATREALLPLPEASEPSSAAEGKGRDDGRGGRVDQPLWGATAHTFRSAAATGVPAKK